jgi:ribose/xylose/arabinose/galactoside ABC-type transport system permease subunit
MKSLWKVREFSTLLILAAEILFFTWYLWPEGGGAHPFLNLPNFLLIFKYSSIYGIAAVGAAMVIIAGMIDLAPGSVIGLTSVVTGYCFVQADWPLPAAVAAGLLVGVLAGAVSAWLVVSVGLPPFIATLGVMGIWRGVGFVITEARFYDLSAKLPANWHVLGIPVDWTGPILMIALAVACHFYMQRFQFGRSVFAVGGNETAALFSGIRVGRVKTVVYVLAGLLASVSGIVLAVVQGQGKAVVGGASLAGGRGSVLGAVLGALIFGVLRNALPQIPGATFYDRMIVGVVVIVIVVMDQVLIRKASR